MNWKLLLNVVLILAAAYTVIAIFTAILRMSKRGKP